MPELVLEEVLLLNLDCTVPWASGYTRYIFRDAAGGQTRFEMVTDANKFKPKHNYWILAKYIPSNFAVYAAWKQGRINSCAFEIVQYKKIGTTKQVAHMKKIKKGEEWVKSIH